MLKRTMAMLIAALMIVACVPVLSFAASPSPSPDDKYTCEVKSDNPNAGQVAKTRVGQDKWTVVATPSTGYKFVKWEVVSGTATFEPNANTATATATLSADAVIRAVFSVKGTSGDSGNQSPETGYSIALAVFACVASLAGAAFVAKKVRA